MVYAVCMVPIATTGRQYQLLSENDGSDFPKFVHLFVQLRQL
jgi:hypothetical protein